MARVHGDCIFWVLLTLTSRTPFFPRPGAIRWSIKPTMWVGILTETSNISRSPPTQVADAVHMAVRARAGSTTSSDPAALSRSVPTAQARASIRTRS